MKKNSPLFLVATLLVLTLGAALSCGAPAPAVPADPYKEIKTTLAEIHGIYQSFQTSAQAAKTAQDAAAALDTLTKDVVPRLKTLNQLVLARPELADIGNSPQDVQALQNEIEDESLMINRLMTDLTQTQFAGDKTVEDAMIRFMEALGVQSDAETPAQ